jgi:hypothetical protein
MKRIEKIKNKNKRKEKQKVTAQRHVEVHKVEGV